MSERAVDYTYDGLGRVRTETEYPDWPATTNPLARTYTYDRDSNLKTLLDPNGKTTSYSYDALNRPTCLDYADPATPTISFTYDRNGNRTGMAEGACNSTPTTSYAYDELDRLKSVTTPATPTNKTLGYRYDLDGNRRKLIYSDGTAVTYTFDKAGRLTSLADWGTPARTVGYEYFADGSLKKVTNPNATTAQYTYDTAQRLKSAVNQNGATTLSSHTYTLDKVGNRTQVDEVLRQITISTPSGTPQTPPSTRNTGPPPGPPAPGPVPVRDTGPSVPGVPAAFPTRPDTTTVTTTTTYGYDNLYRLTRISGQAVYGYDPVGNRLSKGATAYVYDKADRLKSVNGLNYGSDNNGNLTLRGTNGTFAYDQANRLKSATIAGALTTYSYDGDGKRTSKTVSGTTTSYLYDINQSLPVLLEDGARKYVWGLGLAYAVDSSNNVEVFHTDGLGSVRGITDASAALGQTYATDEFGVPTLTEGSRTQPFGFTGEQRDPETGLVYLRARMYDPQLGRFPQRDEWWGSADDPPSLNTQTYVGNNPLNWVDPSGYGKLGIAIRALRETLVRGRHLFVAGRQVSMQQAQWIRRAGGNVQVFGGTATGRAKVARQLERGAFPKGDVMHHAPAVDSPAFRPHFQTRGVQGHTFHGFIPLFAGGSRVLDKLTVSHYTSGWPGLLKHLGTVVDFFNALSDLKDVLDIGIEVFGED